MRYPKFIKPGDSIMFVAPSFGATTYPYSTRVKWSKKFFEQEGFNVLIGENVNKSELPYLSNNWYLYVIVSTPSHIGSVIFSGSEVNTTCFIILPSLSKTCPDL